MRAQHTAEMEPQDGSPGQPPTYMKGTTSATLPAPA